MAKIKCPNCCTEFEADLNYGRFYCGKCLAQIKPGFRMKDGDLIFLNGMFESSTIKPDAENPFEQTRKMFLEFAQKYKADRGFVRKTLEEIRDGLAKEYARANADESYIHRIMESRRAIDEVLATAAK